MKQEELECRILYAIIVAGKIADDSGLTPRQVDEQIWMKGSNYGKYNPELRQ